MYISVAYLIRPKREFIDTLAGVNAELAEYFDNPLIIDREQERRIFGNAAANQWYRDREDEVKRLFIRYIIHDCCSARADNIMKEALGKLINLNSANETDFNRWWNIERISDMRSFESLEADPRYKAIQ